MREALFERAYPLARRAALVLAHAALASGAITSADREDVEQEAVAASWRALDNYDPNRASLPTYVECVVATRIASAVRATHRVRALRPVDFAVDHCADPVFGRCDLRIDVERVLGCCGDDERRIALVLMEHSPSQASRILGVARSTIYQRIQRLRVRFAGAGLGPGVCAARTKGSDAIR